jgi:fibronectin type 3 domain-containing protein
MDAPGSQFHANSARALTGTKTFNRFVDAVTAIGGGSLKPGLGAAHQYVAWVRIDDAVRNETTGAITYAGTVAVITAPFEVGTDSNFEGVSLALYNGTELESPERRHSPVAVGEYVLAKITQYQNEAGLSVPVGLFSMAPNGSSRLFQIVGSVRDGDNYRWTYTATEVSVADGFEYEVIDAEVTVTLLNTIELDNDSNTSGIQSGIQLGDGITAIEPIPDGTVLCADCYRIYNDVGRWYVSYPNAPTIDCESAGEDEGDESPEAPTGLVATGTGDTVVEATWDANTETDLSHYNVYRSSTEFGTYSKINSTDVVTNAYDDTGLTANTTYWYKVTAVDNGYNESAKSDADDATTTNTGTPALPTSMAAVAGGDDTEMDLSWVASTGPDLSHYKIYRSTTSGGTFVQVNGNVTGTTYTDTGRDPGTTYYYKMKAINTFGSESAYTAEFSGTTSNATAPDAPTGLTAVAMSPTTIQLDWDANSEVDIEGYDVYRATTSGGVYSVISGASAIQPNTFDDTTLSAGVTRYYKVKAIDTNTNASGFSDIAFATTSGGVPAAPTNLAVEGLSFGSPPVISVALNWDDNAETDIAYYRIYHSAVSGGPWTLNRNNIVPSFGDTSGLATGTWYFVVRAVNTSGGESANSNEVSDTF